MSRPAARSRLGALLALAVVAAPAAAPAATDGLHVGLVLHSSHLDSTEESAETLPGTVFVDESGGGATLHVGWGFTPSFSLRFDLGGARHETSDRRVDFAYSTFTLDGRYLFRNPERARPYLFGGIGAMAARSRQGSLSYETTGPGIVFGGGLLWFATPRVSIDFMARADFVNWNKERATIDAGGGAGEETVSAPIERDGFAGRLGVGAGWWF